VEKNKDRLPGHVIYKVINLVEKKKNNWELTEVDKIQKAKGLDELNKEMEKQVNQQFDQEDFTKKIKEDLPGWVSYIRNNGCPNKYNYYVTNDLIKKQGYKTHHILQALGEISVDYISSREVSHILATYFNEHLKFYKKCENSEELGKLKEIMLNSLLNLNDMMLDNPIILDFWGEILFNLLDGIMKLSEIDSMDVPKEDEEKIEVIFQAIKCSARVCDGKYRDSIENDARKTNLVQSNMELFDKVFGH